MRLPLQCGHGEINRAGNAGLLSVSLLTVLLSPRVLHEFIDARAADPFGNPLKDVGQIGRRVDTLLELVIEAPSTVIFASPLRAAPAVAAAAAAPQLHGAAATCAVSASARSRVFSALSCLQ